MSDSQLQSVVSKLHRDHYVAKSASGSMLQRNRREILLTNEDIATPMSNVDDDITLLLSPTHSSCSQVRQPVILGAGYKKKTGRFVRFPSHLSRDYDATR